MHVNVYILKQFVFNVSSRGKRFTVSERAAGIQRVDYSTDGQLGAVTTIAPIKSHDFIRKGMIPYLSKLLWNHQISFYSSCYRELFLIGSAFSTSDRCQVLLSNPETKALLNVLLL